MKSSSNLNQKKNLIPFNFIHFVIFQFVCLSFTSALSSPFLPEMDFCLIQMFLFFLFNKVLLSSTAPKK